MTETKTNPQSQPETKVDYSASSGLAKRLADLQVSFAFTSYQSNLLYSVGVKTNGGINVHQTSVPRPMGMCLNGPHGRSLLAGPQIIHFQNVLEPGELINNQFDAGFLPRRTEFIGSVDAHDLGVDEECTNKHNAKEESEVIETTDETIKSKALVPRINKQDWKEMMYSFVCYLIAFGVVTVIIAFTEHNH